ncbi:hypothetical protein KRM18_17465 [Xanthomonas hortorum pv. gardneri]|uniref:PepSY domain-containing protein n=7 Tax=Xanthomonas TaxID=338 RepID=A0A6V7C9G5_9XANT|nr:conserved exported hypothetical protein [Xanthomonas hortorum pv. vitians]CAD0355872.1 hypothetical protein CFBP2044_40710 [Xanthomonas hortorum pv. cynarae]CAD0356637.1 hypothetical protein CFBP8129_41370 [Xanthomonas hortorum pv. gardneri]CAH2710203.1 hypothetical protein NCPPB1935_20915 [Xanthomonas campestris pv. nigromaculans]CAD0311708.1 hypothetical protein CFBP498_10730 [Xanthomonas hortorum pv. vitians]
MTQPFCRASHVVLVALWVAMAAPSAWCQGYPMGHSGREALPPSARGNGRTLSDTIRQVQRSTGGQILSAERVPFDGGNLNRVKYMLDGRVHTVYESEQMQPPPPRRPAPPDAPPRDDNQ